MADAARFDALTSAVCAEGATRAAVIPVSAVETDAVFRDMCAANACGMYGKCWMCPPDIGSIETLMAEITGYDHVLVYQTVSELEDSYDFEGMMEAGVRHNQLMVELRNRLAEIPLSRVLHLGAGGCRMCEVCGKRTGEPCRHPDLAVASLETYGVNVSKLAAAAGMKYINGQDTVTYFGTVLFDV
jgi:predicted metal-binding protein